MKTLFDNRSQPPQEAYPIVSAEPEGPGGPSGRRRALRFVASGTAVLLLCGTAAWLTVRHQTGTVRILGPTAALERSIAHPSKSSSPKLPERAVSLTKGLAAYEEGDFAAAEKEAQRVVDACRASKDVPEREAAARAQWILAFSASNRKDYHEARKRFAELRRDAAKLPDPVKMETRAGSIEPTLEEEGAYQHAVLTAALEEPQAAKKEFLAFVARYPESPRVAGALQRLEALNGGRLPKAAKDAWSRAERSAGERQEAARVAQAMCGPECLAQLLRMRGEKVDIRALAREMRTSEIGTSLEALSKAAQKHGYQPRGVKASLEGLRRQKMPAIALVQPGHYVLVEDVSRFGVTVWNPRIGSTGERIYLPNKAWNKRWQGVTLLLL